MRSSTNRRDCPLIKRLLIMTVIIFMGLLMPNASPVEEVALALDGETEAAPAAAEPVVEVRPVDVFLTNAHNQLLSREDGRALPLTAGVQVRLQYQGQEFTTRAQEETLAQLLDRLAIYPSPLEMVTAVMEGDTVTLAISGEHIFYETNKTVREHETVYEYDDSKADWYEEVITEGRDGEWSETYEIVFQDGVETSRQLIEQVDVPPVTAVVVKGTIKNHATREDVVTDITTNEDGSGLLTLENGHTVSFSKTLNMKGTAYTAGGGLSDITASGTPVRVGVVAVDRKTLPLGTRVYVVSNDGVYTYGFSVAEDTGVKGNIIDLYMDTEAECRQFGVRACTVYVLDD